MEGGVRRLATRLRLDYMRVTALTTDSPPVARVLSYMKPIRGPVLVCLVVAALVSAPSSAVAQEQATIIIDAGGMYSSQPEAPPATVYGSIGRGPGVSGDSFGFVVAAFVPRSSRLDLGVEVSDSARFGSPQRTGGTSPHALIDNQHRDLIISLLLNLHSPREAQPISFEAIGGVSLLSDSTLQRTAYPDQPGYGAFGPETDVTQLTFGLVSGANIDLRLTRHISVVPQVRFHWIWRNMNGGNVTDPFFLLGQSSFVFRPAVALRMRL